MNNPSHYAWIKERAGFELIDLLRYLDYDSGCAIKYIVRAGHKTEQGMTMREKQIEDLKKAMWYIQDRINQLDGIGDETQDKSGDY